MSEREVEARTKALKHYQNRDAYAVMIIGLLFGLYPSVAAELEVVLEAQIPERVKEGLRAYLAELKGAVNANKNHNSADGVEAPVGS